MQYSFELLLMDTDSPFPLSFGRLLLNEGISNDRECNMSEN